MLFSFHHLLFLTLLSILFFLLFFFFPQSSFSFFFSVFFSTLSAGKISVRFSFLHNVLNVFFLSHVMGSMLLFFLPCFTIPFITIEYCPTSIVCCFHCIYLALHNAHSGRVLLFLHVFFPLSGIFRTTCFVSCLFCTAMPHTETSL